MCVQTDGAYVFMHMHSYVPASIHECAMGDRKWVLVVFLDCSPLYIFETGALPEACAG